MARNGSGVYSLPAGSTIANGDLSDASDLNTPLSDIETDLNTPRPIVAGGTGASSASAARTALGLAIGTDVQAYNANLASLSGLTLAADRGLYSTGANTLALFTLTSAGRALLDDADAAAQRTTLGLGGLATLDILDEDDFATNSATRPPSQQSTKAYVDAAVAGSGFSYTFLSSQVTTSGTAFDFTGIPAAQNEIVLDITDVSLSGTNDLLVQLGTSGGPVTTGYGGSASIVAATSASSTAYTTGAGLRVSSAGLALSGRVRIERIEGNLWQISHLLTTRGGTNATANGCSIVDIGAELTQVRLTRSGSDTFDGGSARVGYR